MTDNGLYIQMFSVHGLLRAENMELGRDADTGGQIKYVIELGRALAKHEKIAKVDLFTRLIADKTVSEDYAVPTEEVSEKFRIVRIQCGGKKYMRKERLWPHLDEYVDKTIKFIKREGRIPDLFHGHYPDAGYVSIQLSSLFGVPLVYTGHSMGRSKLARLMQGGMKESEAKRIYRIDRRIQVEEDIMERADLIVTSTHQEVKEQYGMYQNGNLPEFKVIPPGLDIEKFSPFYHEMLDEVDRTELERYAQASVMEEMHRFLTSPDKPIILALCRPDKRKNIAGLIEAYGEDLELQAMANLAIFAGIRKNIAEMEENERDVLTEILLLMDKYDLYGKMAIPKKHDFEYEVPELYKIVAEKKGVFVNPALTEPFGITLIEASATGLPIIATNDGGPKDIIGNCESGILINPTDTQAISKAIKKVISDPELWKKFSKNGVINVRQRYTWDAHVDSYIEALENFRTAKSEVRVSDTLQSHAIGKRLASVNYLLITDIDDTLIEQSGQGLDELLGILEQYKGKLGFGVATGRTRDSAVAFLKQHNVPEPDILITSVGSEIYYGRELISDQGWRAHIANKWQPGKIREIVQRFDFLTLQEDDKQKEFKLSYYIEPQKDAIASIHDTLVSNKIKYNLIYSQERFIDFLPYRASKGKAIRYVSYKWEVPLEHIMVCGDSGNDEEMLRGEPLAVVVANHTKDLDALKGLKNICFASQNGAAGILDGMREFNFIEKINKNKKDS